MRVFITILLLLTVGTGIAWLALGWFNFSTSCTSCHDQESDITVVLDDSEKLTADREEFQQLAEIRFTAMDLNLNELKVKAKHGRAVTRDKMTQAIDDLNSQTEAAREILQQLMTATPERWHALRANLGVSLAELEKGFEKVFSRFMSESTRSVGERTPVASGGRWFRAAPTERESGDNRVADIAAGIGFLGRFVGALA